MVVLNLCNELDNAVRGSVTDLLLPKALRNVGGNRGRHAIVIPRIGSRSVTMIDLATW